MPSDTITTNGGDDVVIGGTGLDTINLGGHEAAGEAQAGEGTVVNRFESGTVGAWSHFHT